MSTTIAPDWIREQGGAVDRAGEVHDDVALHPGGDDGPASVDHEVDGMNGASAARASGPCRPSASGGTLWLPLTRLQLALSDQWHLRYPLGLSPQ